MARKKLSEQEFVSDRAAVGVDMQTINTRLPRRVYKAVKLCCVENDLTIQTFLLEAVTEKLKTMPRSYL